MTKLQASDKPDIAIIPQPGVVENMVKRNGIQPLDDVIDMGKLEDSMFPGIVDAGTFDDKYYGMVVNASVKSLVFYPKKAWEKAGYPTEVKSLDELSALTDKIKGEGGGDPWCLGIFSEGSVGWPATDWFEELVARFGGVDFYNDWVNGDEKFDSDPLFLRRYRSVDREAAPAQSSSTTPKTRSPRCASAFRSPRSCGPMIQRTFARSESVDSIEDGGGGMASVSRTSVHG